MQEYEKYNFAVLQLYDDLSKSCGYVGWNTVDNINEDDKLTEYGYISENQKGLFKFRYITWNVKSSSDKCFSGSGVLVKQYQTKYSIIGMYNSEKREGFIILSDKIRKMINQWTQLTAINLKLNIIGPQGCKCLSEINLTHLTYLNLNQNNIDAQGCKYLSQATWTHLKQIYLQWNYIGAQGCKYLSQSNWKKLSKINLFNSITAQGCRYLSQTNWTQLRQIDLGNGGYSYNNIGAQGCRYLSQTNWSHLKKMNLYGNDIKELLQLSLLQFSYPNTAIKI